jgi:hypothetical protein
MVLMVVLMVMDEVLSKDEEESKLTLFPGMGN